MTRAFSRIFTFCFLQVFLLGGLQFACAEDAGEGAEQAGAEEKAAPTPTAAATAAAQVPSPSVNPANLLRFGMIVPLTGESASWGKDMQNAATLAFEALEADVRKKMALVFEDSQLLGPNAASAFNKLADIDKIKGLVVFGSAPVSEVAPLAEKKEIPMFAVTANKEAVKGKLYAFRHWLDAGEQIRAIIPFMIEHEIHSVAIVVAQHDAVSEYVTKFAVVAARENIEVASKSEVAPQELEFKSVITPFKEAPPDAVLVALLPPQISLFSKKLRDAGVDVPLFSFYFAEAMSEVRTAAGAMDGMVYAAPKLSADFLKKYQDRFGDYPELASGNAYDLVTIFGAAVKAGLIEPKAIANYIRRLKDFHGVLGTYSVTEDNDFSLRAELKRVKRGSFRRFDEQ